ncbi:MAG: AlwI family type II restriction endonuclease [Candidatus Infernicultor aquiphilus]|uniref:AlwI family type II restriction endonuclease n=1 Tax=Candidatus Infernicultor aquiphilus TaxID=1805029 RepID=A0A2M7K618_9BACT|nr:MAG: AlwI family type II restriction endonuclease [Candidatus Atribacteria bacterium CG_4_8_14_3_um_filter_34_18]
MKKPWSITTTVRNPERLRNFLIVSKQLENYKWNSENQRKYQILLIKDRVYGYGKSQFYNGLSQEQIDLIDDQKKEISFEQAEEIFNAKNYKDPAMRGRQSINPLKKFGFVVIKDKKIFITSLGKLFLRDDFDLGEIFFRSFIKWQIPNLDSNDYKLEDGYDIKPFIGVLHLIQKVNEKSEKLEEKVKGISKEEFSLFCPTLVNYEDIDSCAEKIITLRGNLRGKTKQEQRIILDRYKKVFAKEFLGTANSIEIQKLLKNLKDYGDNAIRYFRLTRYIYIRGGGFYIDLEPRRSVEINALLDFDNAQSKTFGSKEEYLDYISDISKPKLPWETKEKLTEIAIKLLENIKSYEKEIVATPKTFLDYKKFDEDELKIFIDDLRHYRRELQDKQNHQKSQEIEQIKKYIEELENIFNADDKSILLEKLLSLGLNALNDALKIKPNYPVGDDNEPTFTAPANIPDIECFYENYNAICEVTMLTGRNQWYNEGQPVMRHLRDFENKYQDKKAYCLFVAPKLHRDTINTFWTAIKYEYEGQKQRIIPLSVNVFVELLKILVEIKQNGKFLRHNELFSLYDKILEASKNLSDSNEWIKNISNTITSWQKGLNI